MAKVYERFRTLKVEPPTAEREVERIVRSALRTAEDQKFETIRLGSRPLLRPA